MTHLPQVYLFRTYLLHSHSRVQSGLLGVISRFANFLVSQSWVKGDNKSYGFLSTLEGTIQGELKERYAFMSSRTSSTTKSR